MYFITSKIESVRLLLVPISANYAQEIYQEFTDEITTYMLPAAPKSIEDSLDYIRKAQDGIADEKEFPVVILDKKTGAFLGCAGVHHLDTDTPSLGIWIKKSAHGNKYGKEAVMALKEWIDKNYDYKFIYYPVDRRNVSSRKIAESLGGIIESEYDKKNMSGNTLSIVEYRIYPVKN